MNVIRLYRPPLWPRLLFFAFFWLAAQALHNGALP